MVDVDSLKLAVYRNHLRKGGWSDDAITEAENETGEGMHYGYQYGGKSAVDEAIEYIISRFARHPAKAGDGACAEGWKLMPLELTDDMAEVIAEHCRCCGGIAETIYTALLAASPAEMETKGEK